MRLPRKLKKKYKKQMPIDWFPKEGWPVEYISLEEACRRYGVDYNQLFDNEKQDTQEIEKEV